MVHMYINFTLSWTHADTGT